MADYSCTSCGAPIQVTNRFSKVLVCGYCGTHLKVKENGLDISGKFPKLAEYPSLLKLGSVGTILGKPFKALGRMRYSLGRSHFDEWFIELDGESAWFAEDDGSFTLYTETYEAAELPEDMHSLKAGQNIMFGDKKVMIKETGTAKVEGGEGELSYYVEPGTELIYVDGVSEGKKVSVEMSEGEIELFIGRPLLKRDIEIKG